jgi:cyclic pyranopterin phosphate synthase
MDAGRSQSSRHRFPPALDGHYAVVDGRVQTRSLEAHIVDHCNLTCAECCSLSPLLPRWTVTPAAFARDLSYAVRLLQPRVFKLVGGEPLLHPEVVELAQLARQMQVAPIISLTTNGFLLPRMRDAFWQSLDALTISRYPEPQLSDEAIATIEAQARRFGVQLNWKQQDAFVVMDRPARCDDEAETTAIYDACWLRERCHLMRAGRFYTCTRPPHLQTLQASRAGGDGPVDFGGDGIVLGEGDAGLAALVAYLGRARPLEACAHCFGGNARLVPHRLLGRDELVRARR